MNTNPPPVGPTSGAVSRRPTRARRSATVVGHPQRNSTTSPGVGAEYTDSTLHVAGSPICLCSSCHLKTRLFPRTQHGRILLPDPSKPDSTTRLPTSMGPPRSRAPSAAAAIAVPSVLSRAMNEERGGSTPRPTQLDNGEGTSTGLSRLSGPGVPAGMRDDWTRLPPLRDFEVPDPIFSQRATPRIPHSQRNRSLTVAGRARPSKDSKPYDLNKSKRPELRPQGVERNELDLGTRSSNQMPSPHLGSIPQVHPSRQSTPSSTSKTRRQSWPDPYEDLGAEKFSQFMGPPNQPDRELNLSGSSPLFQPHSFRSGESKATSSTAPHPTFNTNSPNLSQPSFSQQESMPPIQPQQPYQFQTSANNFEQSPQVITFNSRSENPKPNVWNQSDFPNQELVRDDVPHHELSNQHMQHRVRFQNPVTADTHIPNPDHPRSLSGFQVKWDSERKRRQGYFAQEEGEEKSPFRHYNKTGCDFDG